MIGEITMFETPHQTRGYGLTVEHTGFDRTSGSIGNGGSTSVYSFGSEEAREYFVSLLRAHEDLSVAVWERECLKSDVLAVVSPSGRIKRKKLLALVARLKEEK